ncbi:hypothetical protein AQS8620_01941 [Aquimixticola soesokkakensis]|uniref:Alpha/beta hydrolase family protein n=1 Tax=Aquimixticola soesokkakensis TaxID=1519096 RepID=A0A1Y5SS37_9RHOB|nr:hypothetical protein [Aquimixticola soesokkakensis]SLN46721.1 hypothetical protein AQS8620_01941 [Aquimixticola soesokkakensis]
MSRDQISQNAQAQGQEVARRRVFYIPGYDPIPPRRYRELYRKEGSAQAQISGYSLEISPKPKGTVWGAPFGWHAQTLIGSHKTSAQIDVLVWSDIVQSSMAAGIARTYVMLARTAVTYIGTGALWRLMKLRKGPVIAALYPVAMLLVQLLVALFAGHIVVSLAELFGGMIERALYPGTLWLERPLFYPVWGVALCLGAVTVYAVLRWFKHHDGRFFAYYLMHDYAFSARWQGANPPALEARMAQFAEAVAQALAQAEQGEWDEVLVVGHSSGAHLGVSVLADLARAGRIPAGAPLGFLTLGQVVPMVSFLPKAQRLRADLAFLSTTDALFWLDVTAPGDGCAFALCDPVAVTGVAPPDQRWPLVISAAFTQTLAPKTWAKLRWRFFRLHFQYLCAFDRPRDYDYFQITCGATRLATRFADRPPTPSRIRRAVNTYRDMA